MKTGSWKIGFERWLKDVCRDMSSGTKILFQAFVFYFVPIGVYYILIISCELD